MQNKKQIGILAIVILNLFIFLTLALAQALDLNENAPALSPEEQAILSEASLKNDEYVNSAPVASETDEDSKVSSLKWYYVAVPVFLIVLFLGYVEIKRVKEHKSLIASHQQQKNLALRNYVVANLRKGYTKGQIRNALIKNNYSNQEVEDAFKGIR